MHSEFNHAQDQPVHLLQIWILPTRAGIRPGYAQRRFEPSERQGRLRTIVAPDGRDGSLAINADASIEAGRFDGAQATVKALDPRRLAYVHVARGAIVANGVELGAGDAVTLDGEERLELANGRDAEVLVFDLARPAA
jgi:redox-sensitive bicupin YhaK (pirin superfamily)